MPANTSLKNLHTDLIDAIKGYDEAVKDAESPDMKATFESMASLHRRAHAEIDALLMAHGETPAEGGSFMSAVHKTVISVRSAVTGLDRSSLKPFVDGEKRILTAYDEAIAEGDAPTAEALKPYRSELSGMVARLADRAA